MFSNSIFNQTQNLLSRGLDTENLRMGVISNNIANAGVPGFKRSTVSFESQIKRALNSHSKRQPFAARMTNRKHIPFQQPMNINNVNPRVHLDYASSMRNDGNGVDVEFEMIQALKTQMRYQLMSSMVNRNYGKLKMVMR